MTNRGPARRGTAELGGEHRYQVTPCTAQKVLLNGLHKWLLFSVLPAGSRKRSARSRAYRRRPPGHLGASAGTEPEGRSRRIGWPAQVHDGRPRGFAPWDLMSPYASVDPNQATGHARDAIADYRAIRLPRDFRRSQEQRGRGALPSARRASRSRTHRLAATLNDATMRLYSTGGWATMLSATA